MSRPRLLRLAIWCALAVHWLTIFTLTHLPANSLPKVKVNDKVEHATAYFVLAALLHLAVRIVRPIRYLPLIVLLACAAYGALDEYLQSALPINRDADKWDWAADVTGAAIGVTLCFLVIERWIRSYASADRAHL